MIRISCGGARGSAQINHPDFLGFGGDTTCFLIENSSGDRVVLDLGSGLRNLLPDLEASASRPLNVLLSHLHLDHLVGAVRLPTLLRATGSLNLYAPDHLACTAREALGRLLAPPFWPVDLLGSGTPISFHTLRAAESADALRLGALQIRACATCHPGGSTAYRFEDGESGASVVIATDVEWSASSASQRDELIRLCATPYGAGVLIMDGQYEPSEFPEKSGWGHSTWREAAELARHAGIANLLLTHHDETRADTQLRAMEARLQRECPGARMMRQGETIWVPGP